MRRKFFDAKTTDENRHPHMLTFFGELYDIERQSKDRSEQAWRELRRQHSVPVFERITTCIQQKPNRATAQPDDGLERLYAESMVCIVHLCNAGLPFDRQ